MLAASPASTRGSLKQFDKILRLACAARSDEGQLYRVADGCEHFQSQSRRERRRYQWS